MRFTAADGMFTGPLFHVRRLEGEVSEAERSACDVVRHPGSVAVVALDDTGRVLPRRRGVAGGGSRRGPGWTCRFGVADPEAREQNGSRRVMGLTRTNRGHLR